MMNIRVRSGVTLIDALAGAALLVVLVAFVIPVSFRLHAAGLTEQDAAQQRMIHAALVRDSNGNRGGQLLTPGLVNRLATGGVQVPGEGEQDYAQNRTQNLYSAGIARGLFRPQDLIGPTEVNPVVTVYAAYNYNAYRPEVDSYWDSGFSARINVTGGICNTSYAHLLMCGLRKEVYWRGTADATRPLISTRGCKNGVNTGDEYTRSPTLRLHGPADSWEGNVCFGDNHVELVATFRPDAVTYACGTYNGGGITTDNLFACGGTTPPEFTGGGCVDVNTSNAPQPWAGGDTMLGIHPNGATKWIAIPVWDALLPP